MESRGRQARGERTFETVPRRRQHRQEARAGQPRQPLARRREPRDRLGLGLGRGELGFLFSRRSTVAVVGAVHEHARAQAIEELGRRFERHYGQGKRDGTAFR